jgi:EAL and modified HD-GYP domain-containing signal transduction protein
LALDDYTINNEMQHPLLDLTDIIKVDFMQNSRCECRMLVQNLANDHRRLLAEKVETMSDFKAALDMGYSYFQGYFFSEPVIVPGTRIPVFKINYMKILRETMKREIDFHALERVITCDISLCYTLLKYINSAYFGLKDEITSVLQAMMLLGETEVKRWASIVLITLTGMDKPPEVVTHSLIRAQMCQALAADVGMKEHESELFLLGLFSMVDVLVGCPLAQIVNEMGLAREVKDALLGVQTEFRDLYELVISYEKGQWDKCSERTSKLHLEPERISDTYVKATEWADGIAGGARNYDPTQSKEEISHQVN